MRPNSLLILKIACLASLLAFLAFLILHGRPRQQVSYPDYSDLMQYDPAREGGHLLPSKNLLVAGERIGRPVRWQTNSKGFRNAQEFPRGISPGICRIMFLGDSFVDGMRTDQKDTIGFLLEEKLQVAWPDKKIEVMISGHNNPTNAWYYFQEIGHNYHPRVLILGITLGNDLTWYNYGRGLLPYKSEDGSTRLKIPRGSLRQAANHNMKLFLPMNAYKPPTSGDNLLDREMKIRYFLAERFYVFSQEVPPSLGPMGMERRRVAAGDFCGSLGLFYQPVMSEVEQMYTDFEKTLEGIRHLTDQNGTELLIVLFPVRFQVSEKDWTLLEKKYSLDKRKFDLNHPNRRIMDYCEKEKMHCLDLLPAFKKTHAGNHRSLFRSRGDMHFNEAGQRLAAEELAAYAEKNFTSGQ